MPFEIKEYKKYKVIYLAGDIVEHQLNSVRKIFNSFLEAKQYFIAVDLSLVTYINSIVIGVLIVYFKKYSQQNGSLCFINPNKAIVPIIESLELDKAINFYDSLEKLPV
ncbi:MAG: STAS domain-containing protein [bacterium]